MKPYRQDMLNKYDKEDFHSSIGHKLPRVIYLSLKFDFVRLDAFTNVHFPQNVNYCKKLLRAIPIQPPRERNAKEWEKVVKQQLGVPFVPTIDDDEFAILAHKMPVSDRQFLDPFAQLIDCAVLDHRNEFLIDLVEHGHWERYLQILQLLNVQLQLREFAKASAVIIFAGEALKLLLQVYYHECRKIALKIELNKMQAQPANVEMPFVANNECKLPELTQLIVDTADLISDVTRALTTNGRIRREWNQFKTEKKNEWREAQIERERQRKEAKRKKKGPKQDKKEIEDVDSEESDSNPNENQNEMKGEPMDEKNSFDLPPPMMATPPVGESFSLRILNLFGQLQENIEELRLKRSELKGLSDYNEELTLARMNFVR